MPSEPTFTGVLAIGRGFGGTDRLQPPSNPNYPNDACDDRQNEKFECAYAAHAGHSLQEHTRPADRLAAERLQEIRHYLVHQLEVGRQRRCRLLRIVEDFLAMRL